MCVSQRGTQSHDGTGACVKQLSYHSWVAVEARCPLGVQETEDDSPLCLCIQAPRRTRSERIQRLVQDQLADRDLETSEKTKKEIVFMVQIFLF